MDQRQTIWHALFSLLSKSPQRNTLIMAGDFNCSADHRSNAIGYPTFQSADGRRHGPRHADASNWKQLLSQYDLVALNTWSATAGATYEFGTQSSRIDYICTRRTHADRMSKDVQLLRDFTLVPITGAFHVPLLTTLRREWYPDRPTPKTGWTRSRGCNYINIAFKKIMFSHISVLDFMRLSKPLGPPPVQTLRHSMTN